VVAVFFLRLQGTFLFPGHISKTGGDLVRWEFLAFQTSKPNHK